MLNNMIEEATNGVSTMNIFRHFRGGYYVVQSLATIESTGEQVVIYQSLQDSRVWVRPVQSFCEEVPEGKENPTGQKHRFEKVTSFNNQLGLIPTDILLRELLSRGDCPTVLQSTNARVWREEYLVGRFDEIYIDSNYSYEDFVLINTYDSLERAVKYVQDHPNMKILKRVYIRQDFD